MARFSDEFPQQFGDAVADIRAKYEEVMWGRTVTERGGEAPAWPQAQEPEQSFGSITRNIDVGPTKEWPQAQEQSPKEQQRKQDRDVDIDR